MCMPGVIGMMLSTVAVAVQSPLPPGSTLLPSGTEPGRLVLLAKNARVWLAQLSHAHGREIATLDGIPDAELARLARWGITGLWLIGVWERSRASARIKQLMGDHEAEASAYSLDAYCIPAALGGEAAFDDLKARAWRYGIRLSTDIRYQLVRDPIDPRWAKPWAPDDNL